jgi:hypothetical protein
MLRDRFDTIKFFVSHVFAILDINQYLHLVSA